MLPILREVKNFGGNIRHFRIYRDPPPEFVPPESRSSVRVFIDLTIEADSARASHQILNALQTIPDADVRQPWWMSALSVTLNVELPNVSGQFYGIRQTIWNLDPRIRVTEGYMAVMSDGRVRVPITMTLPRNVKLQDVALALARASLKHELTGPVPSKLDEGTVERVLQKEMRGIPYYLFFGPDDFIGTGTQIPGWDSEALAIPIQIAKYHHAGQKRKGKADYFAHLLQALAVYINRWGGRDPEVIPLLITHDTPEDSRSIIPMRAISIYLRKSGGRNSRIKSLSATWKEEGC